MKEKIKFLFLYIIHLIDLIYLPQTVYDETVDGILLHELEMAKLYPQYVICEEFLILLHNNIYWIQNKYYYYGIWYKGVKLIVSKVYDYFDKKHMYFNYINSPGIILLPRLSTRIKLDMFVSDYKNGKYNNPNF